MRARWWTGRLVGLIAVVLSVPLTAPAVADAAAANPYRYPNRLLSGQCLRATRHSGSAELESPSGRFTLELFATGQFTMDNDVEVPGAGFGYGYSDIWGFVPRKIGRSATACMQPNGNLVLRTGTRRLWQSHTRSRARGGYAALLDSGRFVVRTSSGRTVWSSHTTAVLMIRGDSLKAGKTLVNRTNPDDVTRLEMRRSGDLVVTRNRTVVWHSDTYVRRSYLVVTRRGRLAVISPRGRRVWHTPAFRAALVRVAELGRLVLQNLKSGRCWQRPITGESCYSG